MAVPHMMLWQQLDVVAKRIYGKGMSDLPEAVYGPHLPPQPTDEQWRRFTHATSRLYLGPDFLPETPPSVLDQAARAGFEPPLHPAATDKAERYAVYAAFIRHLTIRHLVRGGGVQARYRNLPAGPLDELHYDLMELHSAAYLHALSTPGDRATALANRILEVDPNAPTTLSFISVGGTGPTETANFNITLADLLDKTKETRRYNRRERIAAAHMLVPVSLGRAAVHGDTLSKRPSWISAAGRIALQVRQKTANGELMRVHRLLRNDGKPLFALEGELHELLGPLLKCPAHHSVYGDETALSRQMHAGVNAAARRGAYDGKR